MASNLDFLKTSLPLAELVKPKEVQCEVEKPTTSEDLEKKKQEKKLNFLKNIKKGIKKDKSNVVVPEVAGKDSDKKKRDKKKWNNSFKMLKIESPHQITLAGRKRFSIKIYYLDNNNKKKSKTIRFGDKSQQEFIDNHDLLKKKSVVSRLQNVNDPFNKSFWRLNLLNNKDNLLDSYTDMIKQLGLY